MKVKELKKLVASIPDKMNSAGVLLQIDPEGNGYETVRGLDDSALVIRHGRREVDTYDSEWTADEAGMTEEEWEELKKDGERVVIIFP